MGFTRTRTLTGLPPSETLIRFASDGWIKIEVQQEGIGRWAIEAGLSALRVPR